VVVLSIEEMIEIAWVFKACSSTVEV